MIRVLIVDDSLVARNYLAYILESDPEISVIGKVGDGHSALAFLKDCRPDVITIDIHMPGMDGFTLTRKIMELNPLPIVIISNRWDPLKVEETFKAMEAGAIFLLEKPKALGSPEAVVDAAEIIGAIKQAKVARVQRLRPSPEVIHFPVHPDLARDKIKIVAIGASTGGPVAIKELLSYIPLYFPVPILIVQHIAPGFAPGFADWLNNSIELPVSLGVNHDFLEKGKVYIAPDGYQMGVRYGGTLTLSLEPPENGLSPSVSYLFRSITRVYPRASIGILLTGMGVDGAFELKQMREMGGITIAQDKVSSIIHGMPGEAIRIGAVDYIFPPKRIARLLLDILDMFPKSKT